MPIKQSIFNDYVNRNLVIFTFVGIKTKFNKQGIEKKEIIKMPLWQDTDKNNCLERCYKTHSGLAVITGEISGVTCFDFDDKDVYNQMVVDFPELSNFKTVKTKNGYHVYCIYDG